MNYVFSSIKSQYLSGLLLLLGLLYALTHLSCTRQNPNPTSKESKLILQESDFTFSKLPLGADSTKAIQTMGAPDSILSDKTIEELPKFQIYTWIYPDFDLYFDSAYSLFGFQFRRPNVSTYRGLSLGNSLERVKELYGVQEDDYGLPLPSYTFINNDHSKFIMVKIDSHVVTGIYAGKWLE